MFCAAGIGGCRKRLVWKSRRIEPEFFQRPDCREVFLKAGWFGDVAGNVVTIGVVDVSPVIAVGEDDDRDGFEPGIRFKRYQYFFSVELRQSKIEKNEIRAWCVGKRRTMIDEVQRRFSVAHQVDVASHRGVTQSFGCEASRCGIVFHQQYVYGTPGLSRVQGNTSSMSRSNPPDNCFNSGRLRVLAVGRRAVGA